MPRRRQPSRSAFVLVLLLSGCAQVPVPPPPPPPPVPPPAAVSAEAVPAMQSGRILVAKVTGTVNRIMDGATTACTVNDVVPPKTKISTGGNSSVVLVFSNGATVELGEQSELVVEEFQQDPFGAMVKLSEVEEEPSRSRTVLALNRGELVGNVKRLRYDLGSSFLVQTPVGAMAVRGAPAAYRLVFRPSGAGQAFFNLSCAKGNLVFQQQQSATPEGGGRVTGLMVPAGQEIVITVSVTQNAQGSLAVTASSPAQPKPGASAKGP